MESQNRYFAWTRLDLRELIPHNFKGALNIFASLSSRNFRLYFFGQCISLCGSWVQSVAMSWLVYRLTGSIILLTTVAFVNQIPNLIITPFAGVLSDRLNRLKIITVAQILFMCQALLLAFLTLSGLIEVWHLVVLSLFNGVVASIEAPSRQSFYSKLVPAKDMTNAIALNSVTINGSRFIGPTIGGIMIALMGEGYCFLFNGISFIAVVTALLMMQLPKFKPMTQKPAILSQLSEGVKYIRGFLPLKAVIIFVAAISFFGMPFMSIIPALVKDILGGDSTLLGYMNSSIGAGALSSAIYLASRKQVIGLGKILTITGFMMGGAMVLISFTNSKLLACLLAFPLGCAMIGSMAASNTLLQTMVDEDKRGRVMSFFTMSFGGMAPLGGIAYGYLAELTSLPIVLFICGVVCLATGAIYEYYRPFVRAAAHDRLAKNGVVTEIANGIGIGYNNPF